MLRKVVILELLLFLLINGAGCHVIQKHWEHIKLKKVAPASIEARRSGELELTCSATGSPAPSISWYKNGLFVYHEVDHSLEDHSSLGETVARLRIPCVGDDDAGQYECRAVAGKHQQSAVTTVKVADWDTNLCFNTGDPFITLWKPTLMIEIGETVVLPCRLDKNIDAVITWTDAQGKVVTNGDQYQVLISGDLVISSVSWSHMGQYSCTATNVAGTTTIHSFVYPLTSSSENRGSDDKNK